MDDKVHYYTSKAANTGTAIFTDDRENTFICPSWLYPFRIYASIYSSSFILHARIAAYFPVVKSLSPSPHFSFPSPFSPHPPHQTYQRHIRRANIIPRAAEIDMTNLRQQPSVSRAAKASVLTQKPHVRPATQALQRNTENVDLGDCKICEI